MKKLEEYQIYVDKYLEFGKKGLVVLQDRLIAFSDLNELLKLTNTSGLFNKTAEDKFEYSIKKNKPIYGFITDNKMLKLSVRKITK